MKNRPFRPPTRIARSSTDEALFSLPFFLPPYGRSGALQAYTAAPCVTDATAPRLPLRFFAAAGRRMKKPRATGHQKIIALDNRARSGARRLRRDVREI